MNLDHAQVSMNIFDAAVIGVFCLSAIVAFFRGFVREVLSLVAWIGAAVITIYLFPQSTVFMKQHVKSEHVAAGAAALGTYFAALITLSLLNSIIIRYLKTGAEVGMIDNLLGLLFGALRGAFIVSLAFLIMSAVVPMNKPPQWLETSITKPYLERGGDILKKVAPGYLSDLEEIVQNQRDKKSGDKPVDIETPDDAAMKKDATDDVNASKENTRKAMDNLLNAVKPQQDTTR